MPAEPDAAFEIFQFESMVGEHGGKFFNDWNGRAPGRVEFQERLNGFRVWQGTAALLTGQDNHRFSFMNRLAVDAFGCFAERFGGVGARGEMNMTGIPLCLPKFAAPFIAA